MANDIKLQEYPLNGDLISKIPRKLVFTFSSIEVKITCFDFTNTHIVFGSNAGCAFLLNRETGHVIKLLCQSKQDHVTYVKLLDSLECQIALGTRNGNLSIIIFSETSVGSKEVQKFSLGQVHKSSISSLEWSVNGMKLFSGDMNGEIFCQEIDFKNKTCSSSFILKEETEIVQIEYRHKLLLVSTLEKSFLLDNGEKRMIGTKYARKGRYGACFNSNTVVEQELKVLATRPGMRVWVSNTAGTVLLTLKMKDIVESSNHAIQLQNLEKIGNKKELVFGVVKAFGADCLVTYHGSSLYVINHTRNKIVGEVHNISNVLQIQVTDTEILILCSETLLHRIAYEPDQLIVGFATDVGQRSSDQSSFTMQDMKESLSGVKKSISPMLGSIQAKVSTFKVENFTSKIQAQANDLKKKVSSIPIASVAEHFITSNRKSSSDSAASSHSKPSDVVGDFELTARATSHNQHEFEETSDGIHKSQVEIETVMIVKKLLKDLVNLIEADGGDLNYLHRQDLQFLQNNTDTQSRSERTPITQTQKGFRHENIDVEETEKLVFSSKLRRKKDRKTFVTASNSSGVHRKESFTKNDVMDDTETTAQSLEQNCSIESDKVETFGDNDQPLNSEILANIELEEVENSSDLVPDTRGNNDANVVEALKSNVIIDVTDTSKQSDPFLVQSDASSGKKSDFRADSAFNIPYPVVKDDAEFHLSKDFKTTSSSTSENTDASSSTSPPIARDTPICGKRFATSEDDKAFPSCTKDLSFTVLEDSVSDERPSTPLPLFGSDTSSNEDDASSDAISSTKYNEDGKTGCPKQRCPPLLLTTVDHRYAYNEDVDQVGTSAGQCESRYQDKCDDQYFNAVKLNPEFYGDSDASLKSSDKWTAHTVPSGSVHCLEGSEGIVCFINNKHHVYCVEESSSHKLPWNMFSKKAAHLAVSASGDFAWLITSKGNIYCASIPVSLTDDPKHTTEINLNWMPIGHKASFVCLGATESWIVDMEGKILRQTGLSRSKTVSESFQSVDVRFIDNNFITSPIKAVQIALTSEVVWLLNSGGRVLCKSMATLDRHSDWNPVELMGTFNDDDEEPSIKFITSDYQKTMWAIDNAHKLWFRSNVTSSNPKGDQWWQVYLNEYLCQEQRSRLLPSVSKSETHADQTAWLSASAAVNSVAISLRSVWVASNFQSLHVTRGAVSGNQWRLARMAGIASSIKWSHISSSSIFSPESGTWEGLIWVAQKKGDVICFTSQANIQRVSAIPPPAGLNSVVVSVSASREALWMLYKSGDLYARTGISSDSPTGVTWRCVDISAQLGDVKLAHVSCGSLCVWAVDEEGRVYVRMGVNVTKNHEAMAPAWLSIDACHVPNRKFLQTTCGPSDINVWALDDHGSTYVRTGVTAELPVGESWKTVQGPPIEKMTISNHTIWALCKGGSILRRCGITQNDCMGDYWQKMPGDFKNLTVTPYDELWAIDFQRRLRRHVTQLYYPPLLEAMRDDLDGSDYFDEPAEKKRVPVADTSWELL